MKLLTIVGHVVSTYGGIYSEKSNFCMHLAGQTNRAIARLHRTAGHALEILN